MSSEKYCIKSTLLLRNSTTTCSGSINLFTGLEARSCGYLNDVFLCRYHYFQSIRKQTCCFPFDGPCSQNLLDCPSRLLEVFDSINPEKRSGKICSVHLQEADLHDKITGSSLYKGPKQRKVRDNI